MEQTDATDFMPPGARRGRTSGIDRALQLLDHLQATGRPATAYEIARSVGAPISTVYVLIDEMVGKRLLGDGCRDPG
jgi:hypothetical protein